MKTGSKDKQILTPKGDNFNWETTSLREANSHLVRSYPVDEKLRSAIDERIRELHSKQFQNASLDDKNYLLSTNIS